MMMDLIGNNEVLRKKQIMRLKIWFKKYAWKHIMCITWASLFATVLGILTNKRRC